MKRLLFASLILAGKLFADEVPIHWEYFEPEVDYTRRLRAAGATTNWEIVNQPTPEQTGPSLKLTFQFSKKRRMGVLVFDLPPIAFDRISFRVWNPNPPTLPVYLHLTAFRSTSLGATQESVSFSSRYYGDTTPAPGQFLRPDIASAPLPSSAQAGWIPVVVKFPQDITEISVNGKRRPPGKEDLDSWKKYAFPTISLMVETKSPDSTTEPISLFLDDVEFFLTK